MISNKSIEKSIVKLNDFCESVDYKGYSLYDSHNSIFPIKKLGRLPSFYINQIVKRSPINFRPILGVKKGINPKGYGLFLHAYSILGNLKGINCLEKANFFYDWLKNNPSDGFSGHCWGYNYYWPKKNGKDSPAYTPSVVVTAFVVRALVKYYERTKNPEIKDIIKSTTSFVMKDIPLYRSSEGYCFSYTPLKKDLTINANLLAAEILASCDYVNNESNYQDYIDEVIKFTLNNQNKNGSWYYSLDYYDKTPKKQIDFHQGYVLESLFNLKGTTTNDKLDESIKKGLNFYYNNQFDKNGFSYWRIPSKYPIDIHNQSQGIITFSRLSKYDSKYLDFSNKIYEWTVKNMQSKKGNFYYQNWKYINNRTNYLRWNQGWMLLAMATLLNEKE